MSDESALHEAVALIEAGKVAQARGRLEQIIAVDPDCVDAWRLMARIAETPELAAECWEQVARLSPSSDSTRLRLATLRALIARRSRRTSTPDSK